MNKITLLTFGALSFQLSALASVPKETDTVIVGAGLSGLATAYQLKKAGIPFHVLELTPRIGGRVRTITYKMENGEELHADSGMEEYWESNPAVKVLQELKLPLTHDEAASSLYIDGKFYEFDVENTVAFLKKIFDETELAAPDPNP